MNILILSARADIGGGPRLMVDLIIGLIDSGFSGRIYVACPHEEPYYTVLSKLATENKISLIELPLREILVSNFVKLSQVIRKESINIVHSHGKGAGLWSRLLKIFFKITVIHHFHGIHIPQKSGIVAQVYIFVERFFKKFTDIFICVSEGEKEKALYYKFASSEKAVVIHNGIDLSKYQSPSTHDVEAAKQRLGLVGKNVVLSVARLAKVKNFTFALDIISLCKIKMPNLIYVVVGGQDDVSIEDLVSVIRLKGLSDTVVLAGEKSDVLQYYYAADLYISTSFWEGLPTTVIEAQATCLPVLATNVVGNMDAIVDGVTGYLLPLGDTLGFVQKMGPLFTDSALRHSFGVAGRENVKVKFDLETIREKYNRLVTRLSMV